MTLPAGTPAQSLRPSTSPSADQRPEPSDIRELLHYLAANVDVARADGDHQKAETFRRFSTTVTALAAQATT